MKPRLLPALLAVSLMSAAHAQGTAPGLWEIQNTMGGNPRMDQAMSQMQQQMAGMTPDQRKMMQDMMAKQGMSMGPGQGGAMAVRICITPDMAARQEMPNQQQGDCKTTVNARTGNTWKVSWVCRNPASDGEGTYTFQSDKAYTADMVMRTTHQGKPETTTMKAQGKWLGADCGNIRPPGPPSR